MLTCTTHEAAVELGFEDEDVVMLAHQGLLDVSGDGYITRASLLLLKSSGTASNFAGAVQRAKLRHLEASYGRA